MKLKILYIATLILFCGLITPAQETISIAKYNLTFVLPEGFTLSKSEEVFEYTDKLRQSQIIISTTTDPYPENNLKKYKKTVEAIYKELWGIKKWDKREVITINHRQWIHLSFEYSSEGKKKYGEAYLTSVDGLLLHFKYRTEISKDNSHTGRVIKVIDSVQINRTTASNNSFNRSANCIAFIDNLSVMTLCARPVNSGVRRAKHSLFFRT